MLVAAGASGEFWPTQTSSLGKHHEKEHVGRVRGLVNVFGAQALHRVCGQMSSCFLAATGPFPENLRNNGRYRSTGPQWSTKVNVNWSLSGPLQIQYSSSSKHIV